MLAAGPAKSSTVADGAWRAVYRFGFPLAQMWWRLLRRRHEGALVALHVGTSLMLVASSYRTSWNFPGGSVRRGEAPESAARREMAEEIGLVTQAKLIPAGEAFGLWEGRRDRVHFFALKLDALPPLRFDNREITGARLVPLNEVPGLPLTGAVRAYIEGRVSPCRRSDRKA